MIQFQLRQLTLAVIQHSASSLQVYRKRHPSNCFQLPSAWRVLVCPQPFSSFWADSHWFMKSNSRNSSQALTLDCEVEESYKKNKKEPNKLQKQPERWETAPGGGSWLWMANLFICCFGCSWSRLSRETKKSEEPESPDFAECGSSSFTAAVRVFEDASGCDVTKRSFHWSNPKRGA